MVQPQPQQLVMVLLSSGPTAYIRLVVIIIVALRIY